MQPLRLRLDLRIAKRRIRHVRRRITRIDGVDVDAVGRA